MKERVVIWRGVGRPGFSWFVTPFEIDSILQECKNRGFEVVYSGKITPDLDAKYPEYA